MRQMTIFNSAAWNNARVELLVLFVLTLFATITLLQMHWVPAIAVTPFIMAALLAVIGVLVQTLWLAVSGIDRLAAACGLRKSPLA